MAGGTDDGNGRFVVQHHLATADHYDVRIEIDGVLVSWAVPKGPSMVAGQPRLAKRTSDHDLAHADVEGAYDRGRSRVGVVQIWDRGEYVNRSHDARGAVSASAGLADGHLSVELFGTKLHGGFSFVRTDGEDMWLLLKKRDDHSVTVDPPGVDLDYSVVSERTMSDISDEHLRR